MAWLISSALVRANSATLNSDKLSRRLAWRCTVLTKAKMTLTSRPTKALSNRNTVSSSAWGNKGRAGIMRVEH